MPSDTLKAQLVVAKTDAELVFSQVLGDQPVEGCPGEFDTCFVASTQLVWALEQLSSVGISNVRISPQNRLTFSFLPGLDAIELAEQVAGS